MAFFRKIKAGLVKSEIEEFVGEQGQLFFNVETGELRLGDDVTPGGISVGGGGGGSTPLTVSLIDSSNTISNSITNVTKIRFDTDSGFDVTNLGGGAVKIGMNSTFKTWKVDGQSDLVAIGLDTVRFAAGPGMVITTDAVSDPKSITFKTIDKTITLYQEGTLTPTTGLTRWYNPSAISISKITARVAEASTDVVTIRIKKSGTTVETLSFAALGTKTTKNVNINMATDDFLTVDILTSGGKELSVEFTYNFE
jgi:hypothetical protein